MTRRWEAAPPSWRVWDGDRLVATCDDFADAVRLCESKPVAPLGGKYEPRPGDVCRYVNDREGSTFVVTRADGGEVYWRRTGADSATEVCSTWPEDIRFVRDSTAAEKRAAGLPVPPAPEAKGESPTSSVAGCVCGEPRTPGVVHRTDGPCYRGGLAAPEAKRPEWVRVVRSESPHYVKDGQVYRVRGWEGGNPCVEHPAFPNAGFCLLDTSWEPAPCPPPVAGRVGCDKEYAELVRAARLTVERIEHFGSVSSVETLRGALKDLDIALSRPVRP